MRHGRRLRWHPPRAAVLLAGGALSLAAAAHGAPSPHGEEPQLLYVCNQSGATISVIDAGTLEVLETIDLGNLGYPPDSKPHHTVVEPDGSFWYVSLIGADRVLKFTRDNELAGEATFDAPGMLALDPTGNRLYVGRSMKAVSPPQRIGAIDRSDMSIEEIDVFFPRPHALAVSRDGRYVYTASLAENRIGILDAKADELDLVTLDGPPHVFVQFAISPDGRTMVATTELTSKLLVFDLADGGLELRHTIDVNASPWHPAFSRDGRFVYFGNLRANSVTMVDAQSWSIAAVIEGEGLAEPHGSAVSADGRWLYISNRNNRGDYAAGRELGDGRKAGTLVVIDTASREITRVLELGAEPAGIGTR